MSSINSALPEKPVNGDAFRGLCDNLFWHDAAPEENPSFSGGDTVFCKIDEVWRLFRALRRSRRRIVLVTHEGDKPVTPELWKQKPPHVARWFGCNMFALEAAATPLPLGIGNATGSVTLSWGDIAAAPSLPRDGLLYANFGIASNPAVRRPLLDWLGKPEQAWITKNPHGSAEGKSGYLRNLRAHHFVYCPPGNGEDTHRMWEALYCGAIPVVRESPAMRDFSGLPILFVPDLAAVTETALRQTLETRALHARSREMLDAKYWETLIANAKGDARQKGPLSGIAWVAGWMKEILRVAGSR